MKYKKLVLVALILSSVIAGAAGQDRASKNLQTRLYVSLAGNDRNNGSLAKPFKSINRALEAAGEIADADVNIAIRGGKYYLDTTILIRSAETTVRSLRISSYAKENVFISAGRKLQLNWTVAGKGLFKARVPANISFERLYINGVLQQMARYPNYDPKARIFNGTSADAIAPERV